jgi:hypothetical protein
MLFASPNLFETAMVCLTLSQTEMATWSPMACRKSFQRACR